MVIIKLLDNIWNWVKSNYYVSKERVWFSDFPSLDLEAGVFSFNV
jgi:hypothetical protein